MQKLQDRRSYRYPPQGFTGKGSINGLVVKCLTPEVQAECHYGYQPDEMIDTICNYSKITLA